MINKPKCAECGNDGTKGGLYLTIDAQLQPSGAWRLEEREDSGGMELDCLNCDHRTRLEGADSCFPYGALIMPDGTIQQESAR